MVPCMMLIRSHRGDAQQEGHAADAAFNAFRDILVLTDNLALKAVMFGSLMLALLA